MRAKRSARGFLFWGLWGQPSERLLLLREVLIRWYADGGVTGEVFPAFDDDVAVGGVEFHEACVACELFLLRSR
jgi:hypothetical protein